MTTPGTPILITVPLDDLEHVRQLALDAKAPLIRWNEAASRMHTRANAARIEALERIADIITATIDNNGRSSS